MMGQVFVLCYYVQLGVSGVFNYINCVLGLCLNLVMVLLIYVYRRRH